MPFRDASLDRWHRRALLGAIFCIAVKHASPAFLIVPYSPLFSDNVSDNPSSLSSYHPRLILIKSQRANASECLASGGGAAAMRPGLKALQQPLSAQVGYR